jgi:hypothetical protein
MSIGIGSTIWVFNSNNRVYRKDHKGRVIGGPIWEKHWEPRKIIGETSRSWLIEPEWLKQKVPKKNASPRGFAFSREEIEERAFVMENRYPISDIVRQVESAPVLRAIVKILDDAASKKAGAR